MSDIKIVIVGNPQVGKSSILTRYTSNSFDECGKPTLGVSFMSKSLIISNKEYKLNIWDTAGQERFNSLTRLYSRDAKIMIFVYDITCRESFTKMQYWYTALVEQGFDEKVVFAVVGNKEDLVSEEKVSLEEAKKFAGDIRALFYKTSAKTNIGIEELFRGVCLKLVEREEEKTSSIILGNTRIRGKKGCCVQ